MDHQQRAACDWQRMIDIRRFFRMHIAVEGERQYKRRKQDNGRENQACQDRIIFSETIQVIIGEVGGVCVRAQWFERLQSVLERIKDGDERRKQIHIAAAATQSHAVQAEKTAGLRKECCCSHNRPPPFHG